MKNNIEKLRIGDVIELKYGKGLPKRDRKKGRIPVYGSGGITGYHNVKLVKGPGIIVGRKGTIGSVYFEKKDFFPIDTVFYAERKRERDDFRFLYYVLKESNLDRLNSDAAVPGLNREVALRQKVKIPKLKTQRKISTMLSAYEEATENNLHRIKILEEMAQLIYQEWFVKFCFPGHEKVKLVDSELGKIPEGWKVKSVSDLAQVFRGRSYRSVDLSQDEGRPFLNLKCIARDGGFRRDGLKKYTGQFTENQTAEPNDIIMAVTDMTQERRIVARAARVPYREEDNDYIYSMDLVKIAPNKESDRNYLYGMFLYSEFPHIIKQHANGANVLHLNPVQIENFKFPLPCEHLRTEFSKIIEPFFREADILANKNQCLRGMYDVLLPRLISGEVDVEELDIKIDEVNE